MDVNLHACAVFRLRSVELAVGSDERDGQRQDPASRAREQTPGEEAARAAGRAADGQLQQVPRAPEREPQVALTWYALIVVQCTIAGDTWSTVFYDCIYRVWHKFVYV